MSFTAQFPGWCADCDQRVEPGQTVRYRKDGRLRQFLVHEACPESVELLGARPGEVACQVCFLIHPEGACDR